MGNFEEILTLLMDCHDQERALSTILNNDQMKSLINHEDAEIRSWVAKALVHDGDSPCTEEYLLCLLKDPEEDVRLEALDSLSIFPSDRVFTEFCRALSEKDPLLRSYAAYGVGAVGCAIDPTEAKKQLAAALEKEENDFARLGFYEGLYRLGEQEALLRIFALFDNDDYHIQCAVLNVLGEILDESNYEPISNFVSTIEKREYPKSVFESLRKLMRLLQQGIQ